MTHSLEVLINEGGIDPEPYFDIAADSLIGEHGAGALDLAAMALCRMDALGDREGMVLWHGVQSAIRRRMPGDCGEAESRLH